MGINFWNSSCSCVGYTVTCWIAARSLYTLLSHKLSALLIGYGIPYNFFIKLLAQPYLSLNGILGLMLNMIGFKFKPYRVFHLFNIIICQFNFTLFVMSVTIDHLTGWSSLLESTCALSWDLLCSLIGAYYDYPNLEFSLYLQKTGKDRMAAISQTAYPYSYLRAETVVWWCTFY